LRPWLHCINFVGNYVEMMRDLTLQDRLPDPAVYFGTVLVSLIIFRSGYRFFMKYKAVFVDVI
jgi:lipopolysaccharide transport system permease protein